MEWIFLLSVFLMSSVENVISLPEGVCGEYKRLEHSNANRGVTVTFCCNYYHKRNGVCVACPIGYVSKGENCTPCMDEQLYGKKCAEICHCDETERCNHVRGCIAKDEKTETKEKTSRPEGLSNSNDASNDKTVVVPTAGGQTADRKNTITIKNHPSESQVTDYEKSTPNDTDTVADERFISATLREFIFFVALIFFGLMVSLGLIYKCWKRFRHRRILITPPTMIELKADNVRQQQTEEQSEGVYDEIDELALSETSTPIAFGTQLHNSYLEVTNDSCNTLNIIGNHNRLSNAQFISQSKPGRQTSRQKHRHSQEENILNGLNFQTALRHYYSDGYLRPETIAHYHEIKLMMENKAISFINMDKVAGQENHRHVYDRPSYEGIVRSASYDILTFPKDVRNLTNGSMFVQNSIYSTNRQLEYKIRHLELSKCLSKRSTI